jgi:hypothetical protein
MVRVYYFIFLFFIYSVLNAQIAEVGKLEIGELWNSDEDIPSGGWQVGFNWPGNVVRTKTTGGFNEIMLANGTTRMGGLSCGTTNWKNRSGSLYPFAVYSVSESVIEHTGNLAGGSPIHMKIVMRREPPKVTVDGVKDAPRHVHTDIDPTLPADAMLSIRWASKLGITFQQDYYAYAAENADSYMLIDFHAINNGNTDSNENDSPELNGQVLTDVYFNYGVQPHVGLAGAEQNGCVTERTNDDWVEYYGENYLDYLGGGTPEDPQGDPDADSLRVFMVWDGDNNLDSYSEHDDTGDPNRNTTHWGAPYPVLGTFLSPQYFGMGILHADRDVDDEANDLSQPVTTVWHPALKAESWTADIGYKLFFEGDGSIIGEDWYRHRPSPQEMGFTEPNDPVNVCRPNPYITIGPYEMPFNSELHWTVLVAVNGLSPEKCEEYGKDWWEERMGGEGISTEEKNALLATGRDSLMKVFSIATRRYFNNIKDGRHPFDTPDAPPAPDLNVTAGPKSVFLSWSDVSGEPDPDTGIKDFAGYRIYRAKDINYGRYDLVWECGGNTGIPVSHSFVDTTVQRGFGYFYYVSSYDDGSQNWENPGERIESGKYLNMTQRNSPVYPYLPPENAQVTLTVENLAFKVNRANSGGSLDTVGIYHEFDIPVDDNTLVSYDVKAVYSSIPIAETHYPIFVELTLALEDTLTAKLRYAYNYSGGKNISTADFIQIARGDAGEDAWLYDESFNVRAHFPTAQRIKKLWIGGAGWDYEGFADNIAVENDGGVQFSDDFNDGDFKNNPAWQVDNDNPVQIPDLDRIVVVPNPYYDKALLNNYSAEPNKIMFFNLPGKCTIRIFTVAGELVRIIQHTDGTSDESWNQITEFNQLVYTGVYIYHVESEYGEKVGKFVIIRTSTQEERDLGFFK